MADIPEEYVPVFKAAGALFGHSWLYLAALAWGESTFDPDAEHEESGARGMFQFMEPTWSEYGHGPWDKAFDPVEATIAAARYLAWIRGYLAEGRRFGPEWEIASYNVGPGRVRNAKDWADVPAATREWIQKIMHQWADWLF